jgi:hypothetical protein
MSSGGWMMVLVFVVVVGSLGLILFSTVRSIRDERTPHRSVWREFGLGLAFLILFFTTWGAHAITEWQVFTDDQRQLGQKPKIGDFLSQFGQGTLENWQSEFLQLFSFVVMAALFIHKGSAESKDGEENINASLRRIEEKLGTLPDSAPTKPGEQWKLPETPLEMEDEVQGRKPANA